MTNSTPHAGQVSDADVVESAYAVLAELTEGSLSGAAVQQRAAEVCRRMFGVVGSGPEDPLWALHAEVTRQFLGAGGLRAAELTEWLAVARNRENPGHAMDDPPASVSSLSEPYSPDSDDTDDDATATPKPVAAELDTVDTVDASPPADVPDEAADPSEDGSTARLRMPLAELMRARGRTGGALPRLPVRPSGAQAQCETALRHAGFESGEALWPSD